MSEDSSKSKSQIGSQPPIGSLTPNSFGSSFTPSQPSAVSQSPGATPVNSAKKVAGPESRTPSTRRGTIFPAHRGSGTRGNTFVPTDLPVTPTTLDDGTHVRTERMQTITSQFPFTSFSTEELRYADYIKENNASMRTARPGIWVTQFGQIQTRKHAFSERSIGRPRLELLRGPAVEIVVGVEPNVEVWSLSKSLVSQYSSILDHAADPGQLRVTLTEEDPGIFALFVEWLLYGVYTLIGSSPPAKDPHINLDAQAWILGDHLQCVEFKNYAMFHLYTQYNRSVMPRAITTSDVRCAFTRSAPNYRLQLFYKHLLSARFFRGEHVEGDALQWDGVLQENTPLRLFVMEGTMRKATTANLIQPCQYYKERKKAESKQNVPRSSATSVTPAKRDAEGQSIKSVPAVT